MTTRSLSGPPVDRMLSVVEHGAAWVSAVVVVGLWLACGGEAGAQVPVRTVWDGVYSEAQAADGEVVYQDACAACHGDRLQGAEAAPALAGPVFGSNWNGTTLNDLAERIRISMPADAPGSLSRRRVADVVAYLLRAGGFPSGEFLLDRQAPVLSQIRYVSQRPD